MDRKTDTSECKDFSRLLTLVSKLSLAVASRGYSLVAVSGLLVAVAFLVVERRPESTWAPVVVTQEFSCPRHVEFSRTRDGTPYVPCIGRWILTH